MKKDFKFYCKIIGVPTILAVIILVYWIYASIFQNPFSKLIPNVNTICITELTILVWFIIYQIRDYSKEDEEKK